jgi:hypothetical protein
MEFGIEILGTVIGAITALVASLFAARQSLIRRIEIKNRRLELMKLYEEALAKEIEKIDYYLKKLYTQKEINKLWNFWVRESANAFVSASTLLPSISKEEIQKEIDVKVNALRKRIEEIEKRFPNQDKIDKIASVNDAILATQIESLTETVKKLEEKVLTKWDVAKIVFQIIAALSGLVGLALLVITFLSKLLGMK